MADHKVLNEEDEARLQHRYAGVVQDLYYFGFKATQRKTRLRNLRWKVLQKIVPPDRKPGVVHVENSLDFYPCL